jgi:hypothetical protein
VVVRRVSVGVLALVVLGIGIALVPVHITPGGAGAIRCGRSLLPGQFQPDDAEGLGDSCRQAATTRTAETLVAVAGVMLIGLTPRRWRWVAVPVGAVFTIGGLLAIFGNAID